MREGEEDEEKGARSLALWNPASSLCCLSIWYMLNHVVLALKKTKQ
jgi:hypothetical protein